MGLYACVQWSDGCGCRPRLSRANLAELRARHQAATALGQQPKSKWQLHPFS